MMIGDRDRKPFLVIVMVSKGYGASAHVRVT